jgi:hypothetical protein
MKNGILYLLVGISLLLNFYLFSKFSSSDIVTPAAVEDHSTEESHTIELAVYMGRMQLFMNKLYFAGINNNTELVNFYVHELEEAMEEIEHAKVVEDGVNISANIQLFGINQLENMEKSLAEGSDFKTAYTGLVASCNNCHVASKYPFIVIKEPINPVFDNQVYEKPTY